MQLKKETISVSYCMCYRIFKQTSMQSWKYVCVIPRTFIQPILMITFVNVIFQLIIHDMPTWCNIALNTNLVIISSNVEFSKYKPVSLFKLIHLIAMTFNSSSSPIKRNSNMANTFNNDEISPLFVFIIFSVFYIMVRKGNQLIVSFIDVGQ